MNAGNKAMRFFARWLLVGMVALPSLAGQPDDGEMKHLSDKIARFVEAVKNAGTMEVFEGLPHPAFDRELLEAEKKRTATIRLHGELFYSQPQDIDRETAEKLRAALVSAATPYRGGKFCGGFHADYAVRWKTAAGNCDVLVCFGCGEIKLYTPSNATIADMRGQQAVRTLLAPFRKERPPSQVGKSRATTPPAPP